MPDVRIGIVTWNVAGEIGRCLDALPAALGDLDAEVVVVDNASHDDSADTAEARGARVIRNHRNVGYARAVNLALADTSARALVALNPDTVPAPGALAALVRVLDERPDVALVVPRLVQPDGTVEHSVHPFPTLGVAAVANLVPRTLTPRILRERVWPTTAVRPGRGVDVPWATGAVHCIRSAAVAGSPVYRERWFMFVEDLDLCWRLRTAGWRIHLEPTATVIHRGNASGRQAFGGQRTARWLNESYDWYGLIHGPARTRVFAFLNLLGTLRRLAVETLAGRPVLGRRQELAVHLRTIVSGPPQPAPPL